MPGRLDAGGHLAANLVVVWPHIRWSPGRYLALVWPIKSHDFAGSAWCRGSSPRCCAPGRSRPRSLPTAHPPTPVLDELIPSALHTVERYANNSVETDPGRLKARLRLMRGLKRSRSARILATGHASVQDIRRGHCELAIDIPARHRLREVFDQFAAAS